MFENLSKMFENLSKMFEISINMFEKSIKMLLKSIKILVLLKCFRFALWIVDYQSTLYIMKYNMSTSNLNIHCSLDISLWIILQPSNFYWSWVLTGHLIKWTLIGSDATRYLKLPCIVYKSPLFSMITTHIEE